MTRKTEVDLVLVHPGSRVQIYQSLGSSLSAIEPPVWASLMATFVRRRGFSVHVLDAEADDLTPEETAHTDRGDESIADGRGCLWSLHGICDAIIERGYDLNIWAYARSTP